MNSTNYESQSSKIPDRVFGALLGLAAGDRIGGPTRMAIVLAESLLDRDGFDADDVLNGYLEWWRRDGFDSGPTVDRVMSLIDGGAEAAEAVSRVHEATEGMTAGCNPAHRIVPLALCGCVGDASLREVARTEAALTHEHPWAGEAAATIADVCRALVRGMTWERALTCDGAGDRDHSFHKAIEESSDDRLSRSGFAPCALAAAIHFVGHSDSFRSAIASSIEFAGRANYCPVIVGALAGARWGSLEVDHTLVSHHGVVVLQQIESVAAGLSTQWQARNEDP